MANLALGHLKVRDNLKEGWPTGFVFVIVTPSVDT